MKKTGTLILVLILALSILAGCGGDGGNGGGGKEDENKESSNPAPTTLSIKVSNSSGYIFNELYVTPTADSQWGNDHLGSTSILKSGGSYDIKLQAYEFNTYDVRVVDEDEDVYLFERVSLENNCELEIVWEGGPGAYVYGSEDSFYEGKLEGGSDPVYSEDPGLGWLDLTLTNDSTWTFTEVYLYESGSYDIGYNHIDAGGPLYGDETTGLGVDDYVYFDIDLVDEDGDVWYFTDVYLEDYSELYVYLVDGDPWLDVFYEDGTYDEYLGDFA